MISTILGYGNVYLIQITKNEDKNFLNKSKKIKSKEFGIKNLLRKNKRKPKISKSTSPIIFIIEMIFFIFGSWPK